MSVFLGGLVLAGLLYVPGWCWRRWGVADALSSIYERLLFSALWSGWLALTLAELGWFSLPLHAVLTLGFCAAGWWWNRGRRGDLLPVAARPRWEAPAYAVLLVLFAGLVGRPFEIVLGGRDAGVYPNTAYAIVHTGSIVQHEPLIAQIAQEAASADPALAEPAKQAYSNFLGVQDSERFIATRFTQAGFFINDGEAAVGRVVPQFLHLYPAWLALWVSALGLYGGLAATGYLGLLAIWSIAMAMRAMLPGRRGALAGVLALALLAFNTLQIWFSRYSTSETCAQLLLWGGLVAWVRLASLEPAQRRSGHGVWYGLLAGLSIGQLVLARIDFFWGVGPLLLVLLLAWLQRRWTRSETALALGLGAMLLQGVAHIGLIARSYFFDTTFSKMQDTSTLVSRLAYFFYTPKIKEVWVTNDRSKTIYFSMAHLAVELALLLAAGVALWLLWRNRRWLERATLLLRRGQRPLAALAALVLLLLIGFAYTIRPQVLTLDALLTPWNHRAQWESFVGAPLPIPPVPDTVVPSDQAAQRQRMVVLGNLVRLGWYVSPLAIVLGALGLAGWIWRGANRRSWLVLLVLLVYGSQYIRDTYGTADQAYIYIARRFLAAALPAFVLGSAWLLAFLATRRQRLLQAAAASMAAALLVFLAATGWRAVRHVEYAGAIDAISSVAARIEPDAIVLARGGDRDTPTNLATPLRYAFQREVLVAYSAEPQRYRRELSAEIRHWQAQGHPVYLLLGVNGAMLDFPGLVLEDRGLIAFSVPEWQQLQNQKPFTAGPIAFSYRLYAVQPASAAPPAADQILELTDYRWQAGGFYPVEQDRSGQRFAWISGAAVLALPPSTVAATLTLDLGLGAAVPPSVAAQPTMVCPVLTALGLPDSIELPCQPVATRTPQPVAWALPPLAAAGERWLFTLRSRTWVPNVYQAEYPTPPNDGRSLGVIWTGGRLTPMNH